MVERASVFASCMANSHECESEQCMLQMASVFALSARLAFMKPVHLHAALAREGTHSKQSGKTGGLLSMLAATYVPDDSSTHAYA